MKIVKTEKEWKAKLSSESYYVLREHGTERAGSSPLNHEKRFGIFTCQGCESDLFSSEAKFESGTGWPSFYAPVSEEAISKHSDRKWFMTRTEIRCATCDGHLGHVFPDGPKPTGLRYCMNGAALAFKSI